MNTQLTFYFIILYNVEKTNTQNSVYLLIDPIYWGQLKTMEPEQKYDAYCDIFFHFYKWE